MYKDNSKSIHNFILIVLDFISLAISYFLATYLWLSVIRKNSEIIKSRIVNEIGLVFFSFLVVIFIFNMNSDFLKRSKVEEFLYTIKINLIFLAVASVAMFIGTFGLRITSIYVISGIMLGMVGGFILGKMKLEPYLSDWVKQIQQNSTSDSGTWEKEHTPFFRRLPIIMQEAWGIVKGVLLYILIGIGIGAFMHGYVPEGFFEQYMSKDNWFAVPLSVVLAVPMYANAAGIVPVIEVFVAKGIPIGTALAFMMAVVGLSLPEATLLKKVMTWRLIGIFFGLITLFIIVLGYLYNIVL